MKKALSLMLVLLMTMLAFAGCGNSESGEADPSEVPSIESLKTIGDVIALEPEDIQSAVYEDVVVCAFKLGDTYYRVRAAISPEQAQEYFDIDYMDEDYEEQEREIVAPLEIDSVENLNDQMLSQAELDALAGKTGKELVEEGWTYNGSHMLEDMEIWMDYGPFLYSVFFDGKVAEADYESFDDEEGTRDMKVKSAEFNALGNATNIE